MPRRKKLKLKAPKGPAAKLGRAYVGHLNSGADAPSRATVRAVNAAMDRLYRSLQQQIPSFARTDIIGRSSIDVAIDRNISLIRTIGQEKKTALAELFKTGPASVEKIQEVTGAVRSKALFWATDQTLKLNADVTQQRSVAAGFVGYRWVTSNDEKVRDECAALDGKVFRWDSPPPGGHPGQKPRCRCTPDPLTESEMG